MIPFEKVPKETLLHCGEQLGLAFCAANGISMPSITKHERPEWPFNVCAYYRVNTIHICLAKCASIGVAGMAWSAPGYTVDRTPYGVIQHELGHHVDVLRGKTIVDGKVGPYFSTYSKVMRAACNEESITSYCPNDAEWFAEMFRLFVTNPDLLRVLRPRTYAALTGDGFVPVWTDTWRERLAKAPARTLVAAENKVRLLTAP